MKTVAISQFRAHLPTFLEWVQRGREVVITNHGAEVARLVPPSKKMDVKARLKVLRKKAKIGDIVSPIDVEWDALK